MRDRSTRPGKPIGGLMHQRTRPHGEVTGLVCAALPGATTAVAVFGPSRHVVWTSPMALFVIVTIAATLCLRGGRGDRGRSPARTGGGRSARYGTARHVGPGFRARRDRPGVPYGPNQAVALTRSVRGHRVTGVPRARRGPYRPPAQPQPCWCSPRSRSSRPAHQRRSWPRSRPRWRSPRTRADPKSPGDRPARDRRAIRARGVAVGGPRATQERCVAGCPDSGVCRTGPTQIAGRVRRERWCRRMSNPVARDDRRRLSSARLGRSSARREPVLVNPPIERVANGVPPSPKRGLGIRAVVSPPSN